MATSYVKQTWQDEPSTDSALEAARLNHMEDGIEGAYLGFTPENPTNKGAANGYCPLNAQSQVPAENLPSYVDDVLEYAGTGAFPTPGEKGKIYVDTSAERAYRWAGSTYTEIVPSPGSSDEVSEGITNLYFTNARAQAAVATSLGNKADKTTTVSAGVGLDGGGDLSANRSLSVKYGSTAGTACQGNDGRLSDARTPTAHTHTADQITGGTLNLNTSGNAATATKLATARSFQTNLASTSAVAFDGSGNNSHGVTGILPVANGGTGQSSAANALNALGGAKATDLATTNGNVTAVSNLLPIQVTQAQYNALGSGRPARLYAIVG